MFCLNCGTKMDDDVEFCPFCGKKMNTDMQVQPINVQHNFIGKRVAVLCMSIALVLVVIGMVCWGYQAIQKSRRNKYEPDEKQVVVDSKAEPEKEPGVEPDVEPKDKVIHVWSFTNEVPDMIEQYIKVHPDFNYDIRTNIMSYNDESYQMELEEGLKKGVSIPDIYCVDAEFAYEFTQGEYSSYAATYEELGIDVVTKIREAQIADYVVQMGTRPGDGQVVGLAYQGTGGAFIYRRSIALETWGTDEPEAIAEIIGAGTGQWDLFLLAAKDLKQMGYSIVSGYMDIGRAVENSASKGWVVDGKLYIDPKRAAFLDLAKTLNEEGYTNHTVQWADEWYGDMRGIGKSKVFGFFGPVWLVNYVMQPNAESTFGDWAVCESPAGFFWGGTWILAHKNSQKKEAVGDIIEWLTLNCTKEGLQYAWANGGTDFYGLYGKDGATSGTVMGIADGSSEFLGGQNMYEVFRKANDAATAKNITEYDERIRYYWNDVVEEYVYGEISRDEAIDYFKKTVADNVGIEVE